MLDMTKHETIHILAPFSPIFYGGEGLGMRGLLGMNEKAREQRNRKRNAKAIKFAREQRSTANEFANTVWQVLRNRKCRGQKFRREYSIQPYTVDFCCVALKLVIEVDGEHHFTKEGRKHDERRDQFLRERGYRVLRINGYEVMRDLKRVNHSIEFSIDELAAEPENFSPLKEGRGEQGFWGICIVCFFILASRKMSKVWRHFCVDRIGVSRRLPAAATPAA
jgi:very-short-patch-repair endonuclease